MSKVQVLTSGTSKQLDAYIPYDSSSPKVYSLPPANALADIVGIDIASDDHIYIWYDNGTVSSGTSTNLDQHRSPYPYTLPPGRSLEDIVGMGIAGSNDYVYTWYRNGTYSVGTSDDLDAHQGPQPFSLPPGKTTDDIVGMAIAGSNDHVFTWYDDQTVSEGRSHDLDHYQGPQPFSLPTGLHIRDVVDMGIAGSNDHVYVWFRRMIHGLAPHTVEWKVDQLALAFMKKYRVTGMTLAVTKNGRGIVSRGYGYASFGGNRAMDRKTRSRIGSVSKILCALGWMKLTEQVPALSEQMPVYGPSGVLADPSYEVAALRGLQRFSPVVGMAIAPSSDRCYAWYDDGTVSSGTSRNLGQHTTPQSYSLPPGKTPANIRAIAIASNDRVVTWYDDGSFSWGTSRKLDAYEPEVQGEDDEKKIYRDKYLLRTLDKAIASDDKVYTWYDDGRVSVGTVREPHKHVERQPFVVPPSKSRYDIRRLAIASDDKVYAWYVDGTVSVGTSTNLGKHTASYGYVLPPGVVSSPTKASWFRSMTVANLLTHSAGFVHSGDVEGARAMFGVEEDDLTYEQLHKYMLRTRKLLFAPGSSYSYSNHGMGLVGHLIETASGSSLHEYVTQKLLVPADVGDPNEGIVPRYLAGGPLDSDVHSYSGKNPGAIETKKPDPGAELIVELAAGGWVASAESLVRLCLATDRLPVRADVLQSATLDKMEAQYLPSVQGRGLGWRVGRSSGATKVAHEGSTGGGKAYVAKFLSGYRLESGVNVGNMNVAVCLNIGASSDDPEDDGIDFVALTNAVVEAVSKARVPINYDLFAGEEEMRRIA